MTEEPRYTWTTTNNINFLDVPANLQHGTGFTSIPTQHRVDARQADARLFPRRRHVVRHGGGEHQVKFGVQFDRLGNDVLAASSRPRVTLRWGRRCPSGVDARARSATTRSAARPSTRTPGFITQGNVHTNNLGLFVQDAWTVDNRLTINAGLRTEREEVPTYTTARRQRRRFRSSASSSASGTSWRRASAPPTT